MYSTERSRGSVVVSHVLHRGVMVRPCDDFIGLHRAATAERWKLGEVAERWMYVLRRDDLWCAAAVCHVVCAFDQICVPKRESVCVERWERRKRSLPLPKIIPWSRQRVEVHQPHSSTGVTPSVQCPAPPTPGGLRCDHPQGPGR